MNDLSILALPILIVGFFIASWAMGWRLGGIGCLVGFFFCNTSAALFQCLNPINALIGKLFIRGQFFRRDFACKFRTPSNIVAQIVEARGK